MFKQFRIVAVDLIGFIFFVGATGCVTPISLQEQAPRLEYSPKEAVIVSVIDNRHRVVDGKPENFVGKAHGSFGIPVDWHVNQVLTRETADKSMTLAQFLSSRIIVGLQEKQWNAEGVELETIPDDAMTRELLESHPKGSRLLVLLLKEWYFSINLGWVTAFNFDTDAFVYVFSLSDGEILEKRFKERDIVDETASESPQNNVLRAYRDQLTQIFNDEDVRAAFAAP